MCERGLTEMTTPETKTIEVPWNADHVTSIEGTHRKDPSIPCRVLLGVGTHKTFLRHVGGCTVIVHPSGHHFAL